MLPVNQSRPLIAEDEVWSIDFAPPPQHDSGHYTTSRRRELGCSQEKWSLVLYWWCETCPCLLGVSVWDENYYLIPVAA